MSSTTQQPREAGAEKKPKESQATKLVEQVQLSGSNELFHSPDKTEFVSVLVDNHRETYFIRSTSFRHYLRRLYFKTFGKPPGQNAIRDALEMCAALAAEGPEHEVFYRIGEADGALWLDLGDRDWIAVRIDSEGWRPVPNPPVRFRRPPGALRLPVPELGGNVDELRQFLNLDSDEDFCLVLSWLCATFRPCGPYPILIVHGEQGSAKSTLARIVRELCDPHKLPIRSNPHEQGDLWIAARHSHIIAFDNVSKIEPWLSDSLCRLSTGGGMGKRELYSDAEETILNFVRPLMVNGIEDLASRGDLADRAIVIYLPVIEEKHRLEERTLWAAFRDAQPRILGALLEAVSGGLRAMEQGTVHLDSKPRMADFAMFAVACEVPLGFAPRTFMKAYDSNRLDTTRVVLETVFAEAIIAFAQERKAWKGTATALIAEFRTMACLIGKDKAWPQSPRAFAGHLRRLAPSLRSMGVNFLFGKREAGTGNKLIYLTYSQTDAKEEKNEQQSFVEL